MFKSFGFKIQQKGFILFLLAIAFHIAFDISRLAYVSILVVSIIIQVIGIGFMVKEHREKKML
ncbi:MAG: hypothetical protein E7222_10500 [Clostridiales bacterium]|nr:hypothetical protein [Clostridiales bacterium]